MPKSVLSNVVKSTPAKSPCPCGSKNIFQKCCRPLLEGEVSATTAEQLMRSRYSAFVESNADYIAATCWPKTTNQAEMDELKENLQNTQWRGLTVLLVEKGGVDDDKGVVEFRAKYTTKDEPGKPRFLREKSSFIKRDNLWYYTEGEFRS